VDLFGVGLVEFEAVHVLFCWYNLDCYFAEDNSVVGDGKLSSVFVLRFENLEDALVMDGIWELFGRLGLVLGRVLAT